MMQFSDLATPSATRAILNEFNISLKRSLGQNFLVNDTVIGKILDLSDVCENDTVLEVGPGIGTLTNALLKHAHHVVAVEKDDFLPTVLPRTLGSYASSFTLINKDAIDLTQEDLGNNVCNKMVSNLPYSVAATIIFSYLEHFSSIDSATVMVQKEVAERIDAKPGTKSYGSYTVKLSMYAGVGGSFDVSRNDFMPPPHVDSTVIRLDRSKSVASVKSTDVVKAACIMADAAFAARRKTILNSCKSYFASRGDSGKRILVNLPEILGCADVDPAIRGERLTPEQYLELGQSMLNFTDQLQVPRSAADFNP